ncbi:MAG TPA: UDP-N-acetylmuramate--L-alanine ligase [Chitinophagaceae bacterium]
MNERDKSDEKVNSIYFIGIGGIGMSALARYFHSKGAKVSGYDKTPSSLTKELEQEGMSIHYEERLDLISKDADLVVYTPAVPKEHTELVYYLQNGYKVVKRSDVLQIATESSFNICIAGTHGKTTITTMVAHLLRHTGYGCNAFLGGISVNYDTNFWSSERNVSVVEADEYDRSFLKLSPDVAIITAMDPDHLDIYGTAEAMEQAFIDFSDKIKPGGLLISKFGLKRTKELKGARRLTYSVQNNEADAHAENIKMINGSYEFDIVIRERKIENVRLNIGGMHNAENAVAAITVASSLNIDEEKIKAAVADFKGVKRRFEYIIKTNELVFIDDYAHHPEELRALIKGARSLFRNKKCTVIFQPHLYTRTRDLADGFAEVLDIADEAILLPIYPARELPIAGVSSEMILEKMKSKSKRVLDKEKLKEWIKKDLKRKGQVVITAGAGDIDLLVEPIKEILK